MGAGGNMTTDTNMAFGGSTELRGLSRRLNPENEPFFISNILLLALSQGDHAIEQCVGGAGQYLFKSQAVVRHSVLSAGHPSGYSWKTAPLLYGFLPTAELAMPVATAAGTP